MNKLINEQKIYAKIINLSGKQRMLSQKTTLFAKRYFDANNEQVKTHFLELKELMKNDHQYIINNLTSEKTNNIYFNDPYKLNEKVKSYLNLLDLFYKTKDIEVLKEIEEYSFNLLPKLDFAVNTFEKESDELTKSLLKREIFILIGTLLTLLLEAIFIVIPSIRIANKNEHKLKKLNKTLEKKIKNAIDENNEKESLLKHQYHLAQMGEMMSNIAHHWRQPLSSISTLTSGIKLDNELNTLDENSLNERLDSIIERTQHLSNTIEHFSSFLEYRENSLSEFSLQDVIDATINVLASSFEHKHIFVKKDMPINEIKLKGDPSNLSQVLINILNNAREALDKKEADRIVNIRIFIEDHMAHIELENNGDPIEKEILDKIFDIYFTTKHQSQGTGLGLYLSYEIIRTYFKGEIFAQNLEEGVRFTIKIPLP